MKIAVQLYSLRDIIKGSGEELLAILPKIKALGYDGVEFAGLFGHTAEEVKKMCEDCLLYTSPSPRDTR